MEYLVTTFYKFMPLKRRCLGDVKKILEEAAREFDVWGLVLIAEEGVNATMAGSYAGIGRYKEFLQAQFGEIICKDSVSQSMPFKRFKVKIKQEIVQLKRTDIQPSGREAHVSPDEWDVLAEDQDAVLIDVRNWYETKLGAFKRATLPKTWNFSQFPDWLEQSDIPKDKKIGIYCTGGIRCEKAAVVMKEQGYENVYQLDGGILNYIEQKPNHNFEGDCFVFDHRLAVGQDLRPSQEFGRCWHCGNGGTIDQACSMCESEYRICEDCMGALPASLCSKNCRYHYRMQMQRS